MHHGANKKESGVWKFFPLSSFMVEVIGYGEWGERKVGTMTLIELNFRHSAFQVFMRCSGGENQEAAGYRGEPYVISIFNVCKSTVSKQIQRYRDAEKGKTSLKSVHTLLSSKHTPRRDTLRWDTPTFCFLSGAQVPGAS